MLSLIHIFMDKATGEPFLVNEEEVTAELEFTPEDYNGYANVTFAFDASAITEDTNLVIFETLLQDGVEVASHRDLCLLYTSGRHPLRRPHRH